jgi:DNA-binding NarL/FixJ family response regulator
VYVGSRRNGFGRPPRRTQELATTSAVVSRRASGWAGHPNVEIVVLTTYADDSSILDALAAGARGYLTKDAGRVEIARALEAAAARQTVLDPLGTKRCVQPRPSST